MNDSKLNLYKRFINSVSGFNGYKHLLNETPAKAVVFVLLLTLILGTAFMIQPAYEFNKGVSVIVRDFDDKVPNFEFKNGELQIEGKMPVILKGEGTTVIIDTSDSPNESILDNYDNALLILKNKMIQKNYANTQATSFSSLMGFSMDKNSVKMLIPLLRWIIALIMIFGVPFFIIGKFLSALFISLIGLMVNSMTKARLQYRDIYRISLYSMTLPLVLCTLLDVMNVMPPIAFFTFYMISCVYTWGAVKSIAGTTMPLE